MLKKQTTYTFTTGRGFTDKCFIFFIGVWCINNLYAMVITALAPVLGITDLTAINTILEKGTEALMVFIGFQVWKTKAENMKKFDIKDNISM